MALVAQWLEHWIVDLMVPRSKSKCSMCLHYPKQSYEIFQYRICPPPPPAPPYDRPPMVFTRYGRPGRWMTALYYRAGWLARWLAGWLAGDVGKHRAPPPPPLALPSPRLSRSGRPVGPLIIA